MLRVSAHAVPPLRLCLPAPAACTAAADIGRYLALRRPHPYPHTHAHHTSHPFHLAHTQLLAYIKKDKQGDALVEKLCQRLAATDDVVQWRNVTFCLAQARAPGGLTVLAPLRSRCCRHALRGVEMCTVPSGKIPALACRPLPCPVPPTPGAQLPISDKGLRKLSECFKLYRPALADPQSAAILAGVAARGRKAAAGGGAARVEARTMAEELEARIAEAAAELGGAAEVAAASAEQAAAEGRAADGQGAEPDAAGPPADSAAGGTSELSAVRRQVRPGRPPARRAPEPTWSSAAEFPFLPAGARSWVGSTSRRARRPPSPVESRPPSCSRSRRCSQVGRPPRLALGWQGRAPYMDGSAGWVRRQLEDVFPERCVLTLLALTHLCRRCPGQGCQRPTGQHGRPGSRPGRRRLARYPQQRGRPRARTAGEARVLSQGCRSDLGL
jgi:hypothetical protein